MSYDGKYKCPRPPALLVANSLVSDRYIQLAPVYKSGPVMPDHGPPSTTTAPPRPAELDDIYGALNKLSVALGPKGANKNGALSTLLKVRPRT